MSHQNKAGQVCQRTEPHYVPPGAGMVGFYECDPPEDVRNHARCLPPFDHEHPLHFEVEEDPYAAPEEMARRRAERKSLGRSRVAPYEELVAAARALLDETVTAAGVKSRVWTWWPKEYAALARACDWRAPAGWDKEKEGESE